MTDLILKGKGVFLHEPMFDEEGNPVLDENGEQVMDYIPYSAGSVVDDSVNPWMVHPKTGDLLDAIRTDENPDGTIEHCFPIEGAARKIAADMKNVPAFANLSFDARFKRAKELMNESAERYNRKVKPSQRIDPYFDEAGNLHESWSRVVVGDYPLDKQTEMHTPHNKHGHVTFYKNSKDTTSFGGGDVLESAAFPSWREFGELIGHGESYKEAAKMNNTYVPTRIGTYGHLEPQDVLTDNDEQPVEKLVKRYTNNDKAPDSPFFSNEAQLAGRENVDVRHIISGLDSSFFHAKGEDDGGTEDAKQKFMEAGYDETTARLLAGTIAGSMWNRGGGDNPIRGGRNAINNNITALYGRIMEATGKTHEEIQREQQSLVRGYRATGMQRLGLSNKVGTRLLESLALSQMLREQELHTKPQDSFSEHPEQLRAFGNYVRNMFPGESPMHRRLSQKGLNEGDIDISHITNPVVSPDIYASQMDIPVEEEEAGNRTYIGPGDNPGLVQTSDQSLYDLMESLQMADARLDTALIKSLPYWGDDEELCKKFSLTTNDLRFITETRGDWHAIAKTLMIDPRVVSAVKLTRGAVL